MGGQFNSIEYNHQTRINDIKLKFEETMNKRFYISFAIIIALLPIIFYLNKNNNNTTQVVNQTVTVKMYSLDRCRYCTLAKDLLHNKGVQFDTLDVSNPIYRNQMITETGLRTVPQIFINSKHIGGWTQLKDLEDNNKLIDLLEGR